MIRTRLKPIGRRGKRLRAADRAWKLAVYRRYGAHCVWPGCWKNACDAHHIESKQRRPDLRFEVENGFPCCRFHHSEIHRSPKAFQEMLADGKILRFAEAMI